MLIDQPARRPTVFDILKQIHRMRGTQPSRNYVSEVSWRIREHFSPNLSLQQQVPTIVEPRMGDPSSRAARSVPSPSNSNLLDFTEPTRQTPLAVSPSSLLSTPIQPQRRGRPIRSSPAGAEATSPSRIAAGSTTSSALRVQESELQKPAPHSTASSNSSLHSKSPQPQLVTDIKKFTADFSDAFTPEVPDKLPHSGHTQPAGESLSASFGFDNSFDPSSSFSGSAQKLSPLRTSKSLQPGMGNGVDNSAAFEATISPPSPMQHAELAGAKTANPVSAAGVGSGYGQNSASAPSPDKSSFEDRYPTLERLHSDSSADFQLHTSPLLSPAVASDQASVSSSKPLRGKGMQRSMPSYHQASLTGGTYGEGHTPASDIPGGIPLPRSNQVTGTAFKMTESTMEHAASYSSDEVPARTPDESSLPDYVDMSSPIQEPTRGDSIPPMKEDLPAQEQEDIQQKIHAPARPNDLLTGDDIDLLTGDDDTALPFISMQPNRRPLNPSTSNKAPPPLTAKPPSLSLNSTTTQSRPGFPRAPSSIYDAQWSPVETAKADLVKSPLPQSMPASARPDLPGPHMPTVTSPIELSASKNPEVPATGKSFEALRQGYQQPSPNFQSSYNSKSSTYPLPNSRSLAVPSPFSDTPDRSSSVNAVASDIGAMALASAGPGSVHASSRNAVDGKKPPVASKPDQLKATGRTSSPNSLGASTDGLGRTRSMYTSGRPAGRTFNDNKSSLEAESDTTRRSAYAATSNNSETSVPADDAEDTGKRSVNALIAQWSRAGPPVQGTPVSALRSKPTIGTGRRL
ncbi:hypothetical protein QFC24_001069 [Naganishia onofrii]|uniref:Uncharacterized protein n=1 Tax=Naganishia onofrii TaxID=1851511 RepID=A0ACC2XUE8_9TREE|nr:hypothetical protein QFC24_001069 [Naganishia onofrii]